MYREWERMRESDERVIRERARERGRGRVCVCKRERNVCGWVDGWMQV